ncbi:cytoplasmic trna 2-thiolation protein 2 [Moniliophthora roreri MCA 2997]|uniref:Cytoplasmic tRNA 2-thiolation protein 2 n=1 Tax=Moniliophthora roreri (strain MCA 2997) TaxID=1381753 RepID=V2X6C3_MONRO|nr:cytoplasmic trna 2-thiolation protein 2 [Moniliophthora roreri MCA 2997]
MSESCGSPSVQTDALMDRRPKFDKSKMCVRCKVNTGNIVIRHAVYCKECFPTMLATKVKRSLDPHINETPYVPRRKALKASGNLLVGFSGGLGSTVVLDLISRIYFPNSEKKKVDENQRGGKSHPRNKLVWSKAAACYVEVCSAFPSMKDRTEEVRQVVETYDLFEFIPIRLENAFDKQWWEAVNSGTVEDLGVDFMNEGVLTLFLSKFDETMDPVQRLRSYISTLPTQTAIHSAVQTLVRLLLLHTAQTTASSHLILGTNLTSLSISLISSISQGGGFSVREESYEEWSSAEPGSGAPWVVRINKPLQDIGLKECAVWAWWNDLKVVGRDKFPGGKQGIGALTRDFIVGLEKDYPSTVSAIARTCSKLAPKFAADGTCALCERPLQRGVQEWKDRISIRLTSDVPPESPTPVMRSLTPHLCYSCHTTLTSRSSRSVAVSSVSPSPLPLWVQSQLNRRQSGAVDLGNESSVNAEVVRKDSEVWERRKVAPDEMRTAISDFLLE